MLNVSEFRGELAALSAALLWAIASFIYARLGKHLPPIWLNLLKSSIAVGLLLLTLIVQHASLPQLTGAGFGQLFLSGAVGIGFGDSVFFASIACLGVRRALLLEAIAPPLSAVLAVIFLAEQLQFSDWLGILLTVAGVVWVIVERTPDQAAPDLKRGILFGLLAASAQASGAVLSRAGLASTAISPLWSSLIRLTAGVMVLLVWLLLRGRQPLGAGFGKIPSLKRFWLLLVAAAFTGTYLGIWLQQTALKYTATGIAQALTATSPLFIIPIAAATGERISLRAVLGAVVALAGIWLLFA
jgi:drug/metabolite transporter (DMT)-like permease